MTRFFDPMTFPISKCFLACFAAFSLFSSVTASADIGQVIPIGDLERWAVFSLGPQSFGYQLFDNAQVQGDFGAAGTGLAMAGNSIINGDVYYRSNRILTVLPGATITGLRFNNQDALLDTDFDEALAASSAAMTFHATRVRDKVDLKRLQNITLSGAPGETVVLNLKSFQMGGASTFTLQGSATTTYIINVRNQFSLAGNASIVLSGGITWNNVLFNVHGKGDDVSLTGNSRFNGILLATSRTVRLRDQAILNGEVVAARLVMQGSSQVIHPPVVSP
jgi:choice-of-anchor A domain-containing protein